MTPLAIINFKIFFADFWSISGKLMRRKIL